MTPEEIRKFAIEQVMILHRNDDSTLPIDAVLREANKIADYVQHKKFKEEEST